MGSIYLPARTIKMYCVRTTTPGVDKALYALYHTASGGVTYPLLTERQGDHDV